MVLVARGRWLCGSGKAWWAQSIENIGLLRFSDANLVPHPRDTSRDIGSLPLPGGRRRIKPFNHSPTLVWWRSIYPSVPTGTQPRRAAPSPDLALPAKPQARGPRHHVNINPSGLHGAKARLGRLCAAIRQQPDSSPSAWCTPCSPSSAWSGFFCAFPADDMQTVCMPRWIGGTGLEKEGDLISHIAYLRLGARTCRSRYGRLASACAFVMPYHSAYRMVRREHRL